LVVGGVGVEVVFFAVDELAAGFAHGEGFVAYDDAHPGGFGGGVEGVEAA
jgi:hypothetical protein